MRYLAQIMIVAAVFLAGPVSAQDEDEPSLMERGAELFFEGLRQEMSPALKDLQALADQYGPSMRDFVGAMGPYFADIFAEVKDWTAYHPPEILPNGDIIMRKKTDEAEPEPEAEVEPDAGTDI